MKKILVPTDFTPASQNAGDFAMSLAQALSAEVHLLHVYTQPIPVGNVPEPAMIATGLAEEKESRLEQEMDRLKTGFGLNVSGNLATGFRGDAINETVKEADAGLVVMGMKEAHKNKRFGSTTIKMIRKSHTPVLIIHEDARFRPLKNIVLAVDFSEMVSSAGFDVLFTFANKFDSSVRVLHIEGMDDDMKASEMAEKLQLGRVLSRLTYYYDSVKSNDVNQGVIDFVNNHPTDLLVMVAHPHSLLERLFNTVHTAAIGSAIKIPLLVLKGQQLYQ